MLRAHTETRMYNDDSGSHHSYVRISRLVFLVSPCVFAPSPRSHAIISLRRRLSQRAQCLSYDDDTAATLGFLFFSCRCRR